MAAGTVGAMTAKASLRERHVAQTRQRILDEAMALFIEQGFDATTVDEIAQRADVSPRTFFRYFATKDALLFHDFEDRLARLRQGIAARPRTEHPFETLVHVLCRMVDDIESSPEERDLVVRLVRERPALRAYQRSAIVEHTEQEVLAALAERAGVPPGDLGIRAMVAGIGACFDIALRDWTERDVTRPFEPLFRETLAACTAAFVDGTAASSR